MAHSNAHLSRVTVQTKHINSDKSSAFNRSLGRSRCITRHLVHVNRRDREPSRIPMKKLVHSMNKVKIKSFIKRLIPKSSALHNLLSTRYRKYFSQKLTNINMWQFWKPGRASKMQKCIKKGSRKITDMRSASILRTLNNCKILSTNPLRKSTLFYPYFFIFYILFNSYRKAILFSTLSYCYHIYKSYIKHIRTLF